MWLWWLWLQQESAVIIADIFSRGAKDWGSLEDLNDLSFEEWCSLKAYGKVKVKNQVLVSY
jgi:hypothetical protein